MRLPLRFGLLLAAFSAIPAMAQAPKPAYDQALAHHAAGRAQQAIAMYTQALRANPRKVEAYVNRGILYLQTQKPVAPVRPPKRPPFRPVPIRQNNALADLNRAIQLDPSMALAFHNRALVWLKMGNAARARVDMDRAMALSQPDAVYHVHRALIRQIAGDTQGALRDTELALGIDLPNPPAPAEAYFTRAQLLHAANQRKAAVEHYERAIELASGKKPGKDEKKKPVGADPRVPALIGQLSDKKWKVREAATLALIKIGDPAVKAATEALKDEDPEVRQRAQRILDAIAAAKQVTPVTIRIRNRPETGTLAAKALKQLDADAPKPLTALPIPADLDKMKALAR